MARQTRKNRTSKPDPCERIRRLIQAYQLLDRVVQDGKGSLNDESPEYEMTTYERKVRARIAGEWAEKVEKLQEKLLDREERRADRRDDRLDPEWVAAPWSILETAVGRLRKIENDQILKIEFVERMKSEFKLETGFEDPLDQLCCEIYLHLFGQHYRGTEKPRWKVIDEVAEFLQREGIEGFASHVSGRYREWNASALGKRVYRGLGDEREEWERHHVKLGPCPEC